jgi:hypothetical protein
MGEWKAQVSVRIRQALRIEIEEFAAKERRTMSNVSESLLEWGIAHLKTAGTIDRLMRTLPGAEQSQDDSVIARRTTEKERVMVPQRFQITLRVRLALRSELEEMAKRESKTLGSVATSLLEWGYEQLKTAGTAERLRQCRIPFSDDKAQPIRATAKSRTDEPKRPMSPGVREDVWKGMKEMALNEDKRLSQLAELVLEWSALQLSAAGSTHRLLKHQIRPVSHQVR